MPIKKGRKNEYVSFYQFVTKKIKSEKFYWKYTKYGDDVLAMKKALDFRKKYMERNKNKSARANIDESKIDCTIDFTIYE